MTLSKIITLLITSCIICSCSQEEIFRSSVEVLAHSDCEDSQSILKLSAFGGSGPYIYQIKHKVNQKIVYTEVSNENELIIAFDNLNQIFYELHVIDDLLNNIISEFEIRAEGTSTITDVLHIENEGRLHILNDVAVNLHKTEFGHELFMETRTDENGKFYFDNIPTGIYSIEVSLPEKYNVYKLRSDPSINDNIRVRLGSKETDPFFANCRTNMNIDLIYKK